MNIKTAISTLMFGVLFATLLSASSWVFVGSAGGGGFTPDSISGLVLWLDPSNAGSINAGSPSNGDPITTWHDLSASVNNATGSGSTTFVYTTNSINGLAAASATAVSSQAMTLGSTIGPLTGFSAFLVFKQGSPSAREFLIGSPSGGAELLTLGVSGNSTEIWDGGGTNFINFTQVISTGTVAIFSIQSGTDATTTIYKTNNVTQTGNTVVGTPPWAMSISTIGKNVIGNFFADGFYGEILIYNRSVNNTEATQAYNYLSGKW